MIVEVIILVTGTGSEGLQLSLSETSPQYHLQSTMPSIAYDSEEPDLSCNMTAIGNPSISRVSIPCFYTSTSSSVAL